MNQTENQVSVVLCFCTARKNKRTSLHRTLVSGMCYYLVWCGHLKTLWMNRELLGNKWVFGKAITMCAKLLWLDRKRFNSANLGRSFFMCIIAMNISKELWIVSSVSLWCLCVCVRVCVQAHHVHALVCVLKDFFIRTNCDQGTICFPLPIFFYGVI